jgi:hypothetical protein
MVGVFILFALLGTAIVATTGDGVAPAKQWATVNFVNAVKVGPTTLMGPYLIVHDANRMARGEPCTTLYRFDTKKGPQEAAVSFMCIPVHRKVTDQTTLTFVSLQNQTDLQTLTEYQFAGDAEGHGVPVSR